MTFNPNFFRQYFGGRPLHYILENGVPKPVSLMEWAEWFETHERRILQDFVCKARANKTTAVRVSSWGWITTSSQAARRSSSRRWSLAANWTWSVIVIRRWKKLKMDTCAW